MGVHSDGFYIERAERSLQAPPQKCRKPAPAKKCREASITKKCHKAAPPKKCRNAAKNASKYAVNAALLKNAVKQLSRRCHVMSK